MEAPATAGPSSELWEVVMVREIGVVVKKSESASTVGEVSKVVISPS